MQISNSFIQAPLGIVIHFREGAHILFPPCSRKFHLRVISMANGEAVFDTDVLCNPSRPTEYRTLQTYHIPWCIEIFQNNFLVFRHIINLTGRPVCLNMTYGALGDMVAWMPAAAAFRRNYNPHLTLLMKREYIEMFESVYPELRFIDSSQFRPDDYYAVYPVGVWGYGNFHHNPTDFQKDNLIDHADNILMVNSERKLPKIALPTRDCFAEYGKYVCIATRASKRMKQWNYDGGWEQVTQFLKENGYRVFCIDADNQAMPPNAEDFTGKKPLQDRINLISGCSFFVGLASGLAWIAWACERPVVMIANFTETWTEFDTPYRLADTSVCHGCYNAEDQRFSDFERCPRNQDFICSKVITPERVIEQIKRVPEFIKGE